MNKITGTKEWASQNINIIRGCSNNCVYCYAKCMAIRFGKKKHDTWENEDLIPAKVRKRYQKRKGVLMYPSSHDITEQHLESHIQVLKQLLDAGNSLLIVSKPRLSVIKALCSELDKYKSQILFRFTIGSTDSKVLKLYEPGASSFEERLECLRYAYQAGYKTSVSAEPILDLNPLKIYTATSEYITDSIWYGKANRVNGILAINEPGNISLKDNMNKLLNTQNHEFIESLYNELKDNPKVKWKESIKIILDLDLATEAGLDI